MIASANHRRVRELVCQKKVKISDEEFFTSKVLKLHFEDLAAAATRRYRANLRITVTVIFQPDSDVTAYTSFHEIVLNAACELVMQGKTREEKYKILLGLFVHEVGHILYTSRYAEQTFLQNLLMCKWYPDEPVFSDKDFEDNKKDILSFMKNEKEKRKIVLSICSAISNIIEDGYIEDRLLRVFPGLFGQYLSTVRDIHYEMIPTVTQLIEKESEDSSTFASLMQMILSYVKFGRIKYGETSLKNKRIKKVFSMLPVLDEAMNCHSGKKRIIYTSYVFILLWEYIKEYIDSLPDNADSDLGPLNNLAGMSGEGKGDADAAVSGDESSGASPTAKNRAETKKDAQSEGDTSSGFTSFGTGNAEDDESSGTASPDDTGSEGNNPQTTEDEKGRIPFTETSGVSEPIGGGTEFCDDYEGNMEDNAASNIERILDKMAEESVCESLEDERIKQLNEFAGNISYGNIHSGVKVRINRMSSVDESFVDEYNYAAPPLLKISKALQKSVSQRLKDRQQGGKNRGLIMGRRLDSRSLYRKDGKRFYNMKLPTEAPTLAVGLLLDESGSMSSSDRATYARATAIIIYDFCRALDIPVMVYGHSTGYPDNTVEMYSYAEFDAIDNRDKYRLMDIQARSCNRDGAALRYVAESLIKRTEEVKLLILVSDGQPSASGYYGSAAEEDLRGIQQEYSHRNVLFLAAAIGDDRDTIQRIYGDSFLDISDLNKLPTSLTNVILQYLKNK